MFNGKVITSFLLLTACLRADVTQVSPFQSDALQELEQLKVEINYFTHEAPGQERLRRETLRASALTLPNTPPCLLVSRRLSELIQALRYLPGGPRLRNEDRELKELTQKITPTLSVSEEKELFLSFAALRRRIAFQNPLLNFDSLLFLKHHRPARGDGHMVDQFFGFNQQGGDGLFVLEKAFSEQPTIRDLTTSAIVKNGRLKGQSLKQGAFLSPDLDFDGKTILFAWTEAQHELAADADWSKQPWMKQEAEVMRHPFYYWSPERTFHIFKMSADGSELTQLTDGPWNDYDPCFLPNGRIVFVSERLGSNARCGGRWSATAVLHCMMPDGADIVPLSYHETNEWQPSVNNDGMLAYTRWDYIDRGSSGIHHLWTCQPDGRDPRSRHGNYPDWPWSRPYLEMHIRAIPDSRKYVATSTLHHGYQFGSLVLIDPTVRDDRAMLQVKRLTPEVPLPESEINPGIPRNIVDIGVLRNYPKTHLPDQCYSTPWPLSEDFYLAAYARKGHNHGIYLVDSFGNKVLLYADAQIPCMDPIPLIPRKRPPIIPVKTQQMAADRSKTPPSPYAEVSVMNVYQSESPWPTGTKITSLRIIAVFPKDTPHLGIPSIGASQLIARGVLGTVPVEEDGSAYFLLPTGIEVYFQALDREGRAVQNMMSGTYTHPGENLSCTGCHESKHELPQSPDRLPLALQRKPSRIAPEPTGSFPLTFPRLVQPVLNAKCVRCHEKEKTAPSLSAERFPVDPAYTANAEGNYAMAALRGQCRPMNGWSQAFISLHDKVWRKEGFDYQENRFLRDHQYSIPGEVGALASPLYHMLRKGHHQVELSPEEWRRLIVWMDGNSPFFGAYHELEKQGAGEWVLPRLGIPSDWKERRDQEIKEGQTSASLPSFTGLFNRTVVE
ncbi:MAG: hypothetical protein WCP12_04595 [bacterium]